MTDEHSNTSEERMAELLRRLNELLSQRQSYQTSGNAEESDFAPKVIELNSKLLPALRKEIVDTRNASRNGRVRKALAKLKRKVENALSGIEVQRQPDISTSRETELEAAVNAAKTNSQRQRAGGQRAQLLRDREVLRRNREWPDIEKRVRKKKIAKKKKTWRFINKALRTTSQVSACASNAAELRTDHI
jgi:hypothetical protein